MAEEQQSGDAPGLAGRIGHTESLGLFRLFWYVGAAKLRKRKWNRVSPPRVCCSVCHHKGVESAPDQARLTCQHLLLCHCSREAGPRSPLCRRDIEKELADQRGKLIVTKIIDHKFEQVDI